MKQYHDLLRSMLENGIEHSDRTGVGTIWHFGFLTRFDLRAGFLVVTTKRVPFRWVAEEFFWFLSGDTSETNLRAKDVDIWAEWADEEHTRKFGGFATGRSQLLSDPCFKDLAVSPRFPSERCEGQQTVI